jgi:hypothetical protein
VSDQLQRVRIMYDERFAREYGLWRPIGALAGRTLHFG